MPEPTAPVVVNIDDQLYALDGLIAAYKKQIASLQQIADDRILSALQAALNGSAHGDFNQRLVRLLCQYSDLRQLLTGDLSRNEHFADNVATAAVRRVTDNVKTLVENTTLATADRWWENRQNLITQLIRAELNNEERRGIVQAQALTSVLEGLLKPGLERTIKAAVEETTTRIVCERITAVTAQPTEPTNG
jgi:hypothetical protein